MEPGDFDVTPAPSVRPSRSALRSDHDDGGSASTLASPTGAAGVRHHLLKTSASGPIIVDRDLPVPPVLDHVRVASDTLVPSQTPTTEPENKSVASPTPSPPPSITCHLGGRHFNTPSPPLAHRPPNQRLYPASRLGRSTQPLSPANNAELGISETLATSPPSSPQAVPRRDSADAKAPGDGGSGKRSAASGEGSHPTGIEVPALEHAGHTRVSKVRQAFQDSPIHHPALCDEAHRPDHRLLRNKVGPFDAKLQSPEPQELFSGPSTAVSLNDTHDARSTNWLPSSAATPSLSDMCRGRFSKVRAAVDTPEPEKNMSRILPSTAPSRGLGFSASKARPFVTSPDRPDHASGYPVHESKARPMADFKSHGAHLQNGRVQTELASQSPRHKAGRVPVAKAKPFTESSLDAVDFHQTHHHHLPKAQAFTGPLVPSAFPSQGTMDRCQRCQVPRGMRETSTMAPTARSARHLGRGAGAGFLPGQVSGKHSISACDEYTAYPGPEPHSINTCQPSAPYLGQGQGEVGEQHSQYMMPLVSKPRPDQRQATQTSPLLRGRSPTLYGRGPQLVGSESPSLDIDNDGFVTNAVFGGTPSQSQAYSKPADEFCLPETSGSARGFIHAPIPVSKVRPAFQNDAFREYAGHTPVSKAMVAEGSCVAPTLASDRGPDLESGKFQGAENDSLLGERGAKASDGSPVRHQSLGSALDYKRTAHWLRDVLNNRESYTARFTERPAKSKQGPSVLPEERRKSESVLSNVLSASRLTRNSSQSTRKSARFDGRGFKRTVNDLEGLLNEALAIASHVVDRPEAPARKACKPPSSGLRSRRLSVSSGNVGSEGPPADHNPVRVQETAGSVEAMESDEVARPKRPPCRHAATYSGLSRRPRLNEILQSYSSEDVDAKMRKPARDPNQTREASSPGAKVAFEVPCRGSSRHMQGDVTTGIGKGRFLGDGSSESSHCESGDRDLSSLARDTAARPNPEPKPHRGRAGAEGVSKLADQRLAGGGPAPRRDAGRGEDDLPERDIAGRPMRARHDISLRRRSHVSLRDAPGFSLAKSRRRQPTARDWSPIRKRFVAAVACTSTALIGVILGIYAGLVPSIQYYIIDQSHATVHGNTGCFLGLALPTFFLWPLPLLHGRKPYILSSLVLAMPLLFPQALAVNSQRLTNTQSWRSMLLVARTLMGASLGFASMNFHSILTDLFGASLMSVNPHQEVVDQYDARRHGGGMGVWLGIWTWCWIGSLGVGFLVGACIIDNHPPAWGFYVSIIIIAVVLFLNVVCPEVRRSAFRRSIAEVRTGSDISRRIARGEIMMHRVKTGPKWWGQEVYHGLALSLEMLRQPGFAILTLYSAWIYAQVVLIIVLLGSLASRLYQLRSPIIGLLVGSTALGACLAIPFQKANVFSRSRQAQMNNNLATLNRRVAWSSHLVRRTTFTLLLPLAGICYAAVSSGPPLHVSIPTLFAGLVGFLSCLAITECNGLVMETFDCSDLSSGMVGRQRGEGGSDQQKRTNYSSFPRVTAGFAVIHGLAFVLAAGATALGGLVTRTLGQQVSTGVVAGILLVLTIMLLLVLVRFTEVQIIPQCKFEAMDKLVEARRRSSTRRASMPNDPLAIMEEEIAWRPAMIGNPTGRKRRMNILELGGLTRWNEVRKKNKLIDEGAHLNRAALDQGMEALDDHMSDLQRDAREFFGMSSGRSKGVRRLRRTDEGSETAEGSLEMEDLKGPRGRGGGRPERCAMSQTSGEEDQDEAQGRRHRH